MGRSPGRQTRSREASVLPRAETRDLHSREVHVERGLAPDASGDLLIYEGNWSCVARSSSMQLSVAPVSTRASTFCIGAIGCCGAFGAAGRAAPA